MLLTLIKFCINTIQYYFINFKIIYIISGGYILYYEHSETIKLAHLKTNIYIVIEHLKRA